MSPAETPHLTDGRLVDLTSGLLDAPTLARTIEHARGCAACEARLREAHADAERLALKRAPRLATAPGVARPVRMGASGGAIAVAPATRRRVMVAAALAAALLLAVAVPTLLRRAPADGLDYWLPAEADMLLMRSAAPVQDDAPYREAIAAYGRRDVRRVIAILGERTIPPEYVPLNLLFASALEWEGRHAAARAVLERLDIDTLPQPARDQARWILYTSLVRDGRGAEARQVAQDLAQGDSDLALRARASLAPR